MSTRINLLPGGDPSFIGREAELARAQELLAGTRGHHADRAGWDRQDPVGNAAGQSGRR